MGGGKKNFLRTGMEFKRGSERKRGRGGMVWAGDKADVKGQRVERWKRIKESRFNRWYKKVKEGKGYQDI